MALKVLPTALASDPERLARFQREAEVLAALRSYLQFGYAGAGGDLARRHGRGLRCFAGWRSVLMRKSAQPDANSAPPHVILNWTQELTRLVPAN